MAIHNVTSSSSGSTASRSKIHVSPIRVTSSSGAQTRVSTVIAPHRTVAVTSSSRAATASGSVSSAHKTLAVHSSSRASTSSASRVSSRRTLATTARSQTQTRTASAVASHRTVAVTSSSRATTKQAVVRAVTRTVSVHSSSKATAKSSAQLNRRISLHSSSTARTASGSTITRVKLVHSSSSANITVSTRKSRVVSLHSSSSAHSVTAASESLPHYCHSSSTAHAFSSATSAIGNPTSSSSAIARVFTRIDVILPSGLPVDTSTLGLQHLLASGVSGKYPFSFAETPAGDVLMANGVDPMILWEPFSGRAYAAGVLPPSAPVTLGGAGVGTITGERIAYQRFLDAHGNPSNLSLVSNPVVMGFDALIDDITANPATGVVTVKSFGHRLVTGESVVFRGVQGITAVNGTRTVAVVDADTFTLTGFVSTALWTQGGSWTWGVRSVVYTATPVPAEAKVARRQILRNLAGNMETLYVDVDTDDLTSTAFASTRDDESLAAQEPVAIAGVDGFPGANRYSVPPGHKSVVVPHSGRIFAAVDRPYSEGSVLTTLGSATVTGVGTAWKTSFVGRLMTLSGGHNRHEILSVDEDAQTAVLSSALLTVDSPHATYSVAPPPAERRLIYYSEAGLAESWPEWNTFSVPDDGDTVTGIFSTGAYLFVVGLRHVYRVVFSGVPATSGSLSLACRRGSVNQRCIVPVEDFVFMLDESGVHSYITEREDKHLSAPIQTVFHSDGNTSATVQVDWSADRTLWHGSADPARETVRWFVNTVGSDELDHAICYHYRADRWWVERYPNAVTSSTTAKVGYRRCVAGSEARAVVALWQGTLDGATGEGTIRGTATSGNLVSLTDSTASFPAFAPGVPVSIVAGTGKGQQRVIGQSTPTTIEVVDPWDVTPDATSVYQVGGVEWEWKSGWFKLSDDQTGNPRDVSVVYKPAANPATADILLYYDHSDTPRDSGYSQSNDGVTTEAGSPAVTVDLARQSPRPGFSVQRLEGHQDEHAYGDLHLAVGLAGVQSADHVRFYTVNVSGAGQGADNA